MNRHTYGPFSFTVPAAWTDRTVLAFVAPETPGKSTPNVVVTRERKQGAEGFEEHVHRRFAEQARLPGFLLRAQRRERASGFPAVRTHFVWQGNEAPIETLVLYIDAGAGLDVMTVTASCVASPNDEWLAAVETILASLECARPPRTPVPEAPPPLPVYSQAFSSSPAFAMPGSMVPIPGVRTRR